MGGSGRPHDVLLEERRVDLVESCSDKDRVLLKRTGAGSVCHSAAGDMVSLLSRSEPSSPGEAEAGRRRLSGHHVNRTVLYTHVYACVLLTENGWGFQSVLFLSWQQTAIVQWHTRVL